MSDEQNNTSDTNETGGNTGSSRRRVLQIGASSVPAIVSLNGAPALAAVGISVGCSVMVTEQQQIDNIDADARGDVSLTRDQVEAILMGDMSAAQPPQVISNFDAYMSYLHTLANDPTGTGASCVLSVMTAHGISKKI